MSDSATAAVTKTVSAASKKANGILYVFLALFIISVAIIFIGTFAYFVSQTNQYKKACSSVKPKASTFGIVFWVIGAALFLIAIGVLIFYFITKSRIPV